MSLEGPPEPSANQEKGPITDEQCLEAMKTGDMEVINAWYSEQQVQCDMVGEEGRVDFSIKLASLQIEAGRNEEGRSSLEDVYLQGANTTEEQQRRIRELIVLL